MGKFSKRLDERVALDLVGRIYAAAVDPSEWPSFLTAFEKAVDGEGTAIWLHDNADASANLVLPESSITAVAQWAPGFLETYAVHYTFTNVWTTNADRYAPGSAVTSDELFPDRELPKTEYYADWLRPQGLRYALGGPVERRGKIDIRFTCLRPERLGQFQNADLQLHQIVIPHIKRALELHVAVTKQRAAEWGVIRALSGLAAQLWILNLEGRIAFATEADRDRLRRVARCRCGEGYCLPPGDDGTPAFESGSAECDGLSAQCIGAPRGIRGSARRQRPLGTPEGCHRETAGALRTDLGRSQARPCGRSRPVHFGLRSRVTTQREHRQGAYEASATKTGARNQAALIRLMLNL